MTPSLYSPRLLGNNALALATVKPVVIQYIDAGYDGPQVNGGTMALREIASWSLTKAWI